MNQLSSLSNSFMSRVISQDVRDKLSLQLIVAAGDNDVKKVKILYMGGADIDYKANITLGSGSISVDSYGISQPESDTNALMVALHNGAFDAALCLVELKADATYGRKNPSLMYKDKEEKALDFLLTDHVPEQSQATPESINDFFKDAFDKESSSKRQLNYQTDLYTPEQRVRLFDAMVANTENPLGLVSGQTMNNALMWGRSEMIPKLVEIGIKIEDEHFVDAANPIHRKHKSIPMLEAVLPYVKDVNVTTCSNINAGHEVACVGDLEAFKWLEERGLDKNAVASINIPTYAHCIAGSGIRGITKDKQIDFAIHLAKEGYPIDCQENVGYGEISPTGKAFDDGSIGVGLAYLSAGADFQEKDLANAIHARHYNKVTTEELVALIDGLSQLGILNSKMADVAYSKMVEVSAINDKNIPLYAPVIESLVEKGLISKIGSDVQPQKTIAPVVG